MAEFKNVAVIGAGVAGLLSARELKREGHRVTVFEKSNQVGGQWVYSTRVETDPLSLDPNREIVHSSCYRSVRAYIPRQLMGFSDYPFNVKENGKLMSFPGHDAIRQFLSNFAKDFGITEFIRFNTEVVRVAQVDGDDDHWVVESKTGELRSREVFDVVVICNGRFTVPIVPDIPGINKWPGKQIHNHNYRVPEAFKDQIVIVTGDGSSGHDISLDVVKVAKEVHIATRYSKFVASKLDNYANMWEHSKIDHVDESGEVTFMDGSSTKADIIIHCTGYKYDYPFLETNGVVKVEDNRVGPLYKHVFPPKLSPSLAFIGVPYHAAHFPVFELQAKWVAKILSGKVLLPSSEEMLADVEEFNRRLEKAGIPPRHSHRLHNRQIEYMDWLRAQMGMPAVDAKEDYWNIFDYIDEVGWSVYRELWDSKNST